MKKAEANTALQYGITGGVVSAVFVILLALLGFENPYSNAAEFTSTLVFVPVFVVLGVRNFRKYIDTSMGFGKGLLVGVSITVCLALTAAVLLGLYSLLFGEEMIQAYIVEMQGQMEVNQAIPNLKINEQQYQGLYQDLSKLNAFQLAQRSFVYRFLPGLLVSLVSAVYFRK